MGGRKSDGKGASIMSYFYCTCAREFNTRKGRVNAQEGRTPYREVDVDAEGICRDCGHYAVATRIWLSPDNDELRRFIMSYVIKEGDNHNERETDRFTYRQRRQAS